MPDVIEAIMKYAFENSPYPVVLSIENHCCLNQQRIMAKTMVPSKYISYIHKYIHTYMYTYDCAGCCS